MSSRLLARVQNNDSNPSAGSRPGLTFDTFPEYPEALCARPDGPLSAESLDDFDKGIEAALKTGSRYLIIDFTRVGDMGAPAVGFLVAMRKRMRARGGDLVLVGMRPKLQRFLGSLGFRDFFSGAMDLRYALEYIGNVARDIFPVSTVCPACESPLGAKEPGRGRCRACNAVLTILPDGSVELG